MTPPAPSTWPFDPLLPFGYRVIYADPAWDFIGGGDRNARNHYACMSLDELRALPVGHLAAKDCALFMWVTDPFLAEGIKLGEHWGFRYTSVGFYWAKTTASGKWHFGTGYGTRANPEQCLLFTMGDMGLPNDRSVRRLVIDQVREHSRKPDRIPLDIERLYDGPYVELFSRTKRAGWSVWGNETDMFPPSTGDDQCDNYGDGSANGGPTSSRTRKMRSGATSATIGATSDGPDDQVPVEARQDIQPAGGGSEDQGFLPYQL